MAGYGNFDKKDKSPGTWQVMETLEKKVSHVRDNGQYVHSNRITLDLTTQDKLKLLVRAPYHLDTLETRPDNIGPSKGPEISRPRITDQQVTGEYELSALVAESPKIFEYRVKQPGPRPSAQSYETGLGIALECAKS